MKYLGRSVPRVLGIWAFKGQLLHDCGDECRKLGHRFRHNFSTKPFLYKLSSGRLLVTSAFPPPKKISLAGATKIYERTDAIQIRYPKGRTFTIPQKQKTSCIYGLPNGSFVIGKF